MEIFSDFQRKTRDQYTWRVSDFVRQQIYRILLKKLSDWLIEKKKWNSMMYIYIKLYHTEQY